MPNDFEVLSRVLESRYSCRGYQARQVAEADIEEIVAAASRVPTWCNAQPWKVLVTRGAATKEFSDVLIRAAETEKMEPDFDTGNLRFKARERYSFGFSDWRSYYGASGSS